MYNFEYYTPTRVVFGKNSEKETGRLIKAQDCKKVLIHYGGTSAKKSGLLDRVCESLDEEGVEYVMLSGVVPNPHLSLVREGIELCKKEGVDFILAVGGGSVIDSSKAIGYGVANEGDVWDFYDEVREPQGCLPIGAILTQICNFKSGTYLFITCLSDAVRLCRYFNAYHGTLSEFRR